MPGHREQQHQRRGDEFRHCQAEAGSEHQAAIGPLPGAQDHRHAEHDTDAQREQQRQSAIERRHRQRIGDQLVDAVVGVLERRPEVAADDVAALRAVLSDQ